MHSIAFQHNTGFVPSAVINRAQQNKSVTHDDIRDAVRAWSAAAGQDVVAALIVEEWLEQGGEGISFPPDISRQRQKLFRFLDNRFDSEEYRHRVQQLTPAIMAVLPLEYRTRLVGHDDVTARITAAMKECVEAKQAVLLGAPEHQKLKEVSEGITSLFRLMPDQVGPLMTIVTSMLGAV